jgi:hypothetical protein
MSDEQIIALLTEIRDLHRLNAENYKVALQNQAQSLEVQKAFVVRQKKASRAVLVIAAFIVVVIAILVYVLLKLIHVVP